MDAEAPTAADPARRRGTDGGGVGSRFGLGTHLLQEVLTGGGAGVAVVEE